MKTCASITPTFLTLIAVLSPALLAAGPGSWRGQSVTEFGAEESKTFAWEIVNDGVMGGLSEGNIEMTDGGTMRFFGNLSLDNNGGFSTVRSGDVALNLSNDLGLLLRVRGDGRTYEARLATDATYRGMEVSFMGEFETKAGEWTQVKIPFSSFAGSFRGRDLPDAKLDPSMIQRIGILLADKKAGTFDLEIDYIRTYGKGQGAFTERRDAAPGGEPVTATGDENRLISTAVADGRFTTFKKALDAAGLTPFFQWDNPLTVFAPTDEAFARIPAETLENLLRPENKQQLVALLSHHVVTGSASLANSLGAGSVKTIEGGDLAVSFSTGRIRVNDAILLEGDIECSDGILHVVDTVLLPGAIEQRLVPESSRDDS